MLRCYLRSDDVDADPGALLETGGRGHGRQDVDVDLKVDLAVVGRGVEYEVVRHVTEEAAKAGEAVANG